MTNVAVLGSNSFSGSDFIDVLLSERDCRVIGISRSAEKRYPFVLYPGNPRAADFTFHRLDFNSDMDAIRELLLDERPEYIVNFAAQSEVAPSWEHPEQWFRTNAVAVASLGNFLRKQDWLKRYVHISSPEVYGTCDHTVKEDAPLNPSTPYAASKAAGDLMLSTLVKQFDFPMVTIRATNVYGACQQLFKIIPRSVIYIKLGKKIKLHGGGRAVKSYIHIRDVSRGELAAMERGENGLIYHLSPDKGIAVRDVVRTICDTMGVSFEDQVETVGERPGQDKAYLVDSSRARERLDWKPSIGFEEGIASVVAWVEDNWREIRDMPLEYIHKP